MRVLLVRGMLVGLVAGVLAFVVAKVIGEPSVGSAIAFEGLHDAAEHAGTVAEAGHVHAEEFSRSTQSGIGLFTGLTLFGIAIGGIFALAFACVQGRLGGLGVRGTAALVAVVGFLGVYLVPFLKYPANPPAVGDADTIGRRTALYVAMMLLALAVVGSAVFYSRSLAPRLGAWNAGVLSLLGAVVAIGVAYVLMPGVNEVPDDFPADVLWDFRIASLAIQATVYAGVGLLFGWLTERSITASVRAADGSRAGTVLPARG